MWHEIIHCFLQGFPVLKEIATLFSVLKTIIAAVDWTVKRIEDFKNSLCFYNETSVPKMKLAM